MALSSLTFDARESSPDTPASGSKIFLGADGKFFSIDSSGSLAPLGTNPPSVTCIVVVSSVQFSAPLQLSDFVASGDTRLSNAREPLPHIHSISDVNGLANALTSAATTFSTNAPSSPLQGSRWVDTSTMRAYEFYDGVWVEVISP